MNDKPIPDISDLSRPYWEAVQRKELRLQRCSDCHSYNSYALRWCSACWSLNLEWTPVSGTGSLESFSVIHMAPGPAFADLVPYAIGIIELQEKARMMTNIVNCPVDKIRVGMPVTVTFEKRREDFLIPQFEPARHQPATDNAEVLSHGG